MDKSPNDSNIDLELTSIFNRQSHPASPFVGISPFFGGQLHRDKPLLLNHGDAGLANKLFKIQEAQEYDEGHRRLTGLTGETPKLPNLANWAVQLHSLERDNGDARLMKSKPIRSVNKFSEFNDAEASKIGSVDAITSATICTKSMTLFNPKAKSGSSGLNLKDCVHSYDEKKYNLTTFFLRSINTLSNSVVSIAAADEVHEPTGTHLSAHKKINKAGRGVKGKLRAFGARKVSRQRTSCNCKNSGCVKLYCECFRTDGFCGPHCKCKDCKNFKDSHVRTASIKLVKEKQSEVAAAGLSNIGNGEPVGKGRACKCKRSQCTKKYCECYSDGAFCNTGCGCVDCANGDKRVN